MQEILTRINKIAGVRGCAVVGTDGLVIASDMAQRVVPEAMGASTASVSQTVFAALQKLEAGPLKRYLLQGTDGGALLWALECDAFVVVLLRKEANIGMVQVELKTMAEEIAARIRL